MYTTSKEFVLLCDHREPRNDWQTHNKNYIVWNKSCVGNQEGLVAGGAAKELRKNGFAAPRATSPSQFLTQPLFEGCANPSQFPTHQLFLDSLCCDDMLWQDMNKRKQSSLRCSGTSGPTISYKSVGPLLKKSNFCPPSPRFNVE